MDPSTLLAPSSPLGYPAPYWFLALFKVIGFVLHMIPMNLWYMGILIALMARLSGNPEAQLFSSRLFKQMPVIIALGINFGIVPLLFVQVAYYKAFYPATILMGWFWLAVIPLLTIAYYGIYIYVHGLKANEGTVSFWQKAFGWIAAVLFLVIGFIFSNAFSLMANISIWPALWEKTSIAGAPLGIALHGTNHSPLPRWLMLVGLAICTTSAYAFFDAHILTKEDNPPYKEWVRRFSLILYSIGIVVFAVFGTWYVFGTWPHDVKLRMLSWPQVMLVVAPAASPGVVWILLFVAWTGKKIADAIAYWVAAAHILVLALNGISRQVVQNLELSNSYDITAEMVNIQWSPMLLFLLFFVAAVATILWMLRKAVAETSGKILR